MIATAFFKSQGAIGALGTKGIHTVTLEKYRFSVTYAYVEILITTVTIFGTMNHAIETTRWVILLILHFQIIPV